MTTRTVLWRVGLLACAVAMAGCDDGGVAVSASGGSVAVSHRGSLWLADVQRESWREAAVHGQVVGEPVWSPDESRVVFQFVPSPDTAAPEGQQAEAQVRTAVLTVSDGTVRDVGGNDTVPSAWTENGTGWIGVGTRGAARELRWFGPNGALSDVAALPAEVQSVGQIVPLAGSTDVALIGAREEGRQAAADVYVCRGRAIARFTSSGDVLALGSQSAAHRLLIARVTRPGRAWTLALESWNPKDNRLTPLALAPRVSTVLPQENRNPAVERAALAPAGNRLALVVRWSAEARGPGDSRPDVLACFVIETSGRACTLVRQVPVEEAGTFAPAWSRDGSRLALLDTTGEQPQLLIYNADGTGKRLVPPPPEDKGPSGAGQAARLRARTMGGSGCRPDRPRGPAEGA